MRWAWSMRLIFCVRRGLLSRIERHTPQAHRNKRRRWPEIIFGRHEVARSYRHAMPLRWSVDSRASMPLLAKIHFLRRIFVLSIHALVCAIPMQSMDVDLIDHSSQAVEHYHQFLKAIPTNNQLQVDPDEQL